MEFIAKNNNLRVHMLLFLFQQVIEVFFIAGLGILPFRLLQHAIIYNSRSAKNKT